MAGLFTHTWIANLVLKKLSQKSFISKPKNVDDYYFGSIAPDIRYIDNSPRETTHYPHGHDSLFEALKISSLSMPFIAGYETHLVVDSTWANDNYTLEKSIYEHYRINPNNPIEKFSLYLVVDDYFQGEAGGGFNHELARNILRANDSSILQELGFSQNHISLYKALTTSYLKGPGIDTFKQFNLFPLDFDETSLRKIVDQKPKLTSFLRKLKKASVEQCTSTLEQYI